VPVSVITALIGVPFFLYLASRRAKSGRARGAHL
jgi:ABC-type Fe3+-siderophore transport system permease subunit